MARERKEFMVEDAQILFRNFAGAESQYNRKGDRKFTIILPPDVAQQMTADGWNVRVREPREEGDEPLFLIDIAVSYKNVPPKVILITSTARTLLTESTVDILDYAELELVDLICNGYDWNVQGKTGTKAYLKSMYVTIEENALEKKYGYDIAPPSGEVPDDEA